MCGLRAVSQVLSDLIAFRPYVAGARVQVYCTWEDFVALLSNPLAASTTITHNPLPLVYGLHIYHCIAFDDLTPVDWAHHIINVLIVCLLCLLPSRPPASTLLIPCAGETSHAQLAQSVGRRHGACVRGTSAFMYMF